MQGESQELAFAYDRRDVHGSGPYRVEVAAKLHQVRFPERCVRCGGAPAATLPLVKLYYRHRRTDGPARPVYESVPLPCCDACRAAHEAARRPADPVVLRRLRNRFLLRTLPYWLPIGIIVWLLAQLAPSAAASLDGGESAERLLWLGVVLFLGLCLLRFVHLVLAARRHLVADHPGGLHGQSVELVRGPLGISCVLPGPSSPTLAAVDFADEDDELFERARRTFTFARLDVAAEFAAINADLVYDANAPAAIRARWARTALAVLVVGAGVVLWLWDALGF